MNNRKIQFQNIPIGLIKPNNYNPNFMDEETFDKEVKSIETYGFLVPIVVRFNEDNTYTIIDGEHRYKAAMVLKYKEVPCVIVDNLSDKDMKSLTIILNELKGTYDKSKMHDLLEELSDFDDFLNIMPFEEDELNDLLKDVDLATEDDLQILDEFDTFKEEEIKIGSNRIYVSEHTLDYIEKVLEKFKEEYGNYSDAIYAIFEKANEGGCDDNK